MYYVRWGVAVLLLLISNATWVPKIRIAGVGPDLLLGVVFVLALKPKIEWGVWAGLVVGLIAGTEEPAAMGAESMAYILAGILVWRGARSLDRTNPVVLLVLLFAAALTAETVRALWLAGRGGGPGIVLWFRWALPGALYTTVGLPLLATAAIRILGRRDWLTGAA